MVSILTASIFFTLGLFVFAIVPLLGHFGGVETQLKIGTFYYKQSARIRHQFTYLRRVLSGYDVLPITVDPEQKLLKLTLKKKRLKDSNEYPFKDPDNRIKRLFNKPVALAFELIPAAIDAELSEIGYWAREKRNEEGFWDKEWDNDENWSDETAEWTGEVDPFVRMADHLHLVDPIDAFELVPNDVDPENVKTAEQLTKERFSKYGPRVSLESTLSAVIGYLLGMGSVAASAYIQEKLLDGGGGGGGVISERNVFTTITDPQWIDVVVSLL